MIFKSLFFILAITVPAVATTGVFNPDIGVTADFTTTFHNANEHIENDGFYIRELEFSAGASIDPYASFDLNILVGMDYIELHEAFVTLPALPFRSQMVIGRQMASFGRISTFHTHFLPTLSQSRLFIDYLAGSLLLDGVEVSTLLPFNRFVEVTGGVYNHMDGHTHDRDPTGSRIATNEYGPGNPPPGCHYHGTELHCPAGEADFIDDTNAPQSPQVTNMRPKDFSYLGTIKSSFDFSPSFSADIYSSVIHTQTWRKSQREGNLSYSKTAQSNNITIFWHPATQNLYRNATLTVENLNIFYTDEEVVADGSGSFFEVEKSRYGIYSSLEYRQSSLFRGGFFGEYFQTLDDKSDYNNRAGVFLTIDISHFQFFRIEIARYMRQNYNEPIYSLGLQYDVTIGYHTHGAKR